MIHLVTFTILPYIISQPIIILICIHSFILLLIFYTAAHISCYYLHLYPVIVLIHNLIRKYLHSKRVSIKEQQQEEYQSDESIKRIKGHVEAVWQKEENWERGTITTVEVKGSVNHYHVTDALFRILNEWMNQSVFASPFSPFVWPVMVYLN